MQFYRHKTTEGVFIQGLNDSDMLVEITRELTKTEESKDVTKKQVLALSKIVEVQKA